MGESVVKSARAMTTNEVLRLSGTQWLGQGSVAKCNGSDRNQKLWRTAGEMVERERTPQGVY